MATTNSDTTDSRIDWPTGWTRTPPGDRQRDSKYSTSLSKAFRDLETELDRIGVDSYRYSFDAQQRKTDQRPYTRANPDDPGFVLRWKMDGAEYAVACDHYTSLRGNVRTIGLYLQEKRRMENRPVETGESEFANARLPPADEDTDAVVAGEPPAHTILGVDRDASPEKIRAAYRERVKETHPDQGGDEAEYQRVQEAREELLDGE